MELTLVIVTLFSLALALGLGVVAWRLLQEDRRRADARVAALVEGFAQRAAAPMSDVSNQAGLAVPFASAPTTDRGAAREADAEAHASAFRDDTNASSHTRDTDAGADVAESAIAESAMAGSAPGESARMQPVMLDATSKDWLLEFPSARTDAPRAEPARTEDTSREDDWDDVVVEAAEDVSIAHAAWPEARRAGASRQSPLRDWREVRTDVRPDPRTDARIDTADADADASPFSSASNSAHELFGQISQADEAVTTNRFTQVALIVALLFGVGLSVWTVSRLVVSAARPATATQGVNAAGGAANGATSGATGATGAAANAAAQPLELLALRQSRSGTALTIDGLVRNPSAGVRQERLTAVVFFYDAGGAFLTSARTPLDFRTLAPGDESPFKLTLQPPSGVSRYRVSFRYDEGGIVAHVDRRQATPAQALSRAGS